MTRSRSRTGAAVAVAAAASAWLGACSSSDSRPDPAAFCAAYEAIAGAEPFGANPVTTPEEMRASFQVLHDLAVAVAAPAPDEVRGPTDRYVGAIDHLMDLLGGVDYDPRYVDADDYRAATDAYTTAARSLSNAAAATCD